MSYVLLRYSTAVVSQDDNYVSTDFSLFCLCYLPAFDSKSPKFMLHERLMCLKEVVIHIININEISKNKTPYLTQYLIVTAAVIGYSCSVCSSK